MKHYNNNKIILFFLILLSSLLFLNTSFSNNHGLINLISSTKTSDIIINENEYKDISSGNITTDFKIKDKLKIYYVGSYNPGHVCGQPQINSFFRKIQNIDSDYDLEVDIEGWYLDTTKKFTDKYQINNISRYVIKDIKRYQPDVIYVTDDAAFEYIGIPLSNKYPIFFSGINQSYTGYEFKYKGIINDNNIIGVDELIDLDKLYELFRTARIFPNKWYFINDNTDVSKYIYTNLKDELYKIGVKHETLKAENTKEFIKIIKDLNNNRPGIIVNNVHSLYSNEYKMVLDTTSLAILLVNYNKTHLEFSINKELCKYGLSIVSGSDYHKMGHLIGQMFINILSNKSKKHIVRRLNSEITINYKRIEELPYYRDLLNHLDKIDNIVSSY